MFSLLLTEAMGGFIFGCIAISCDNDYHYNVVNIIMTFHFENRFLQERHLWQKIKRQSF